jgi:hypothetical protein
LFGNEGVVYSETRNRFAGLDTSAVAAYRAFDAGASIQDLRAFHDQRELSPVLGDGLEAIYDLAQGTFPPEEARLNWPSPEHLRPDPVRPRNAGSAAPASASSSAATSGSATVEILGIPVYIEYPLGPFEDFCRDSFRNCRPTTQPARHRLSAQFEDGNWAIYGNGHELLSLLQAEQLGLGFLHGVRSLLYAEAEYDVAFHASMVADGDHGIMLCAPRESGKSTLAAHLVAQQFELVTDEPALLRLDDGSVSPLSMPISLKEGSWSVLQRDWPQLAGAFVHTRSDDTRICLLHPPQTRFPAPPRRLTHIVFPEYSSSTATEAERTSPLRTLSLLNESGMILGKHLAREGFEAFLRLVCVTPAYKLRYASLEEAGELIHKMTSESSKEQN